MLKGQCLCASIHFQVNKKIEAIYQCHCSLCRRQSGTHANHATLVQANDFVWLTGQDNISTYKKDTGFTSSFCKKCGSPVPNQVGHTNFIWIPLGLIDDEISPTQHLNFCLSSKANWEKTYMHSIDYQHLPTWDETADIFK
ncbi:MAG: GFA family protein [Acinetobacter sp.]